MPTSTSRYRFEFRMHDWAQRYARSMCGCRTGFFIGLRDDGSPRRVYFARPGESIDNDRKNAMVDQHPMWVLYAPYDEPDHGYLEWYALDRATAERWLGSSLEDADFIDVRGTETRDAWPLTWRVIVG